MEAAHLVTSSGIGTIGIRAICREANLTERTFTGTAKAVNDRIGYIYDCVQAEAHQAMPEAMIEAETGLPAPEAAIRAFADYLAGDPRRAKIFLMEAEGTFGRGGANSRDGYDRTEQTVDARI